MIDKELKKMFSLTNTKTIKFHLGHKKSKQKEWKLEKIQTGFLIENNDKWEVWEVLPLQQDIVSLF